MSKTPTKETRTSEEENRGKKALEGGTQLQAGAGNESAQETAFEKVTKTDFSGFFLTRGCGNFTEGQNFNTGRSSIDFDHESPEIPAEHPAHS